MPPTSASAAAGEPNPRGLSAAEASARLAAEGPNLLPGSASRGNLEIALGVLRDPTFTLLCAACGIYLLLGDVHEAAVLGAFVVLDIVISVVQERKSERALEALRDLSSPRALVLRDGAARRIAGADVVRGDLLVLAEGDRVPADGRLVAANDLLVDESLLTGESLPVEKQAGKPVFSGTMVLKGQGRAEVLATGARTEFGRIGHALASLESERSPLQVETARMVKVITVFAVALAVLATALYVYTRGDWLGGALAGLTLAMSIVPQEFPLVLTVFLAMGAWRISRDHVLTRRMPAIEALGSATVLCVDKTGTLTENRMALAEVLADDPVRALEAAALACEHDPFDPMERAIVAAASPQAIAMRREWLLERDYPFGAEFLAVCHAWRSPQGARRVAIKGAAETVMPLCGMDRDATQRAHAQTAAAAERGLRLLAVAEADATEATLPGDPRQHRFRWLGFVALADPLRGNVPEAVALCRRAGIRVVMITGDHPGTATAIARQAGIEIEGGVLTGREIGALDDAQLTEAVRRVSTFARITPEQKLRLVQAFRAAGEVVAMTGDGVNDAPALKAAHIGVAMGMRGTDVAREAASLVLLEDDFGSIVRAVRLGRRIYENIGSAMRYLLAAHVPIAGMSLLPLSAGWPIFLFPVHVVFLEFVIAPACSIAFEAEPSEEGAMSRPPRDPRAPLFGAGTLGVSLLLGASVLSAVGLASWWAVDTGRGEQEARAIGFAAIVFGNLALILANRSRERTILGTLLRPNPALWWVIGGTLAALGFALYAPPAAAVFRFAPLGAAELAVAAAAGISGVLWYDLYKLMRPRRG
jgi:Ca2+-transporting ATPase